MIVSCWYTPKTAKHLPGAGNNWNICLPGLDYCDKAGSFTYDWFLPKNYFSLAAAVVQVLSDLFGLRR